MVRFIRQTDYLQQRVREFIRSPLGGRGPGERWLRWGAAAIVVVVGAMVSTIVFCEGRYAARKSFDNAFQRLAADRAEAISRALELSLRDLEFAGQACELQQTMTRDGFTRLARKIVAEHEGVRAVVWAPRVAKGFPVLSASRPAKTCSPRASRSDRTRFGGLRWNGLATTDNFQPRDQFRGIGPATVPTVSWSSRRSTTRRRPAMALRIAAGDYRASWWASMGGGVSSRAAPSNWFPRGSPINWKTSLRRRRSVSSIATCRASGRSTGTPPRLSPVTSDPGRPPDRCGRPWSRPALPFSRTIAPGRIGGRWLSARS